MRVLITGATGFIGSWVARALTRRGHQVRALLRPTATLDNLGDVPFERAVGDVLDPASLTASLPGCDAVMHVAGVAHFLPFETQRMYEVNIEGVRNVLAAARAGGIRRAVVTSSVGACGGGRAPRVADEETPSNVEALGIDYLITKYRGEELALAQARRGGMEVCVTRPSVVLGPGDIYHSSAHTFLALAARRLPVYVAGGASFCDVRDVADGHVAALERGRNGEIYILGGPNLEIRDMVQRVATMAGVKAPRAVPLPVAYAVAAAVEVGGRLLRKKVDLSRQLVKASSLYTFVSSAKAERELGYRTRSFEESLRDTLRFFLETGRLKATTPELAALTA